MRGAEQPAQPFDGVRAGAPAVPAGVDEESEEQGEGDEPQADQVELALIERGQVEMAVRNGGRGERAGLRAGFFLAVGIWPGPLRRGAARALLGVASAQDCLNRR